MVETCTSRQGHRRFLHAIIDWEAGDVWRYIRERGLEYSGLYDEGFERLGCVLCPLANQRVREHEAERWPGMVAAYRRAFVRLWDRTLAKGNRKYADTWESGEAMFEAWLHGKMGRGGKQEAEEGQGMLFE